MTGKEFQSIRKKKLGWSQDVLARALHITQGAVSQLEGKEKVSQVHRLAILHLAANSDIDEGEFADVDENPSRP